MSYGAPWERGVSAADTMPQRDLEVPGLVPDVGGVELQSYVAGRRTTTADDVSGPLVKDVCGRAAAS